MNLFTKKQRRITVKFYAPNTKLIKAVVGRKLDRARREALAHARYTHHVLTTGRAPKKTLLQRIFG